MTGVDYRNVHELAYCPGRYRTTRKTAPLEQEQEVDDSWVWKPLSESAENKTRKEKTLAESKETKKKTKKL